jgi:DNA-binding transcriptional regulator LsrR (DeoR family)
MRAKAAAIMALKIQGHTNEEIAEQVGLSVRSLRQYLWIAGKNGWLTIHDPHEYAENVLLHRVVSNLDELLHARNAITGLPDKEVTLELAKRGLEPFKERPMEAPVVQQANQLSINIVMPEGKLPQMREGSGGGAAAYVDGDVVK